MSKARQRAFEAYPPKYAKQERHPKRVQSVKVDTHQPMRAIYIKGYSQAEKDLALTWEDIRDICRMWIESKTPFGVTGEALSIEVLKRFNKQKEDGKI